MIVIYISKIDGKRYICLENQAFFDNDLYRLRVISHLQSTDDRIQKYSSMSVDKSIGEFYIVYKKNECSAMA